MAETDLSIPKRDRKLLGVLVTFRRPHGLSTMLSFLAEQQRRLDALIVVDNEASSRNQEIVNRSHRVSHMIEYVAAPENLGPAGGIALGMERILQSGSAHDWIVLMDDNNPPWSPTLLGDLEQFGESVLARDPRTAGVGVAGPRMDWRRVRLVLNETVEPVDYLSGGAFPFYLASAVQRVGPFAAELFFGFEELEYGLRLRKAGFTLYMNGRLWRQTQGVPSDRRPSYRLAPATWRRYYELRNLFYLLRSYGRAPTAVRVLLVRGLAKPLMNMFVNPRVSLRHLCLSLRAWRDAWTGRLGRTLEPDTELSESA